MNFKAAIVNFKAEKVNLIVLVTIEVVTILLAIGQVHVFFAFFCGVKTFEFCDVTDSFTVSFVASDNIRSSLYYTTIKRTQERSVGLSKTSHLKTIDWNTNVRLVLKKVIEDESEPIPWDG